MKPIHKLLLTIPFLALSLMLYIFADTRDLAGYNSSFVSAALGVATFSISFSFLQYQFSPYKALLRAISRRHLFCCYLTVLIALIPLAVLIINKADVPVTGIFCLPALAYGAILLPLIANEETDPSRRLKAALRKRAVNRYLKIYKSSEAANKEKREKLEFEWPQETPMHDVSSKYNSAVIVYDPFALIRNISELSLKNGDQIVFEKAISCFFTLVDRCIASDKVDYKSGFRFSVNTQARETFELIMGQVVATKNTPLISFLIYATGDFVKEKALTQLQTRAPYNNFIEVLVEYASTAMHNNRDGVVYISSLCRQLAQKGIYEPEAGEEALFFKNYLTGFANQIKVIGQEAIRQKDADIMYRCLEDLGFLGCTAVKQNHYQVTIECLQGLVQLGREARANDVRCFWRHCALDMVDHADERIGWMITWLPGLPEKDRNMLAESFGVSYSRLHGQKQSISFKEEGDKLVIVFNRTEEIHKEGYANGRYYRSVDYSDEKEIKEFKLY